MYDLSKIYKLKHELWLKITFFSFMIQESPLKSEIYEFSKMQFRHMKWLSNEMVDKQIEYNYDRDEIDIEFTTLHSLLNNLIITLENISQEYGKSALFDRLLSDELYTIAYLKNAIKNSSDYQIKSHSKERKYDNKVLSKSSNDALVRFLFEESYKEYELIMIYSYMQNHTNDIQMYNIYQDLVDESHYHLKSFGEMMSKMGILTIPRVLIESLYKREDIYTFLKDGIVEEEAAKLICQELAKDVEDQELQSFFTFIDKQENYHIQLLNRALTTFY